MKNKKFEQHKIQRITFRNFATSHSFSLLLALPSPVKFTRNCNGRIVSAASLIASRHPSRGPIDFIKTLRARASSMLRPRGMCWRCGSCAAVLFVVRTAGRRFNCGAGRWMSTFTHFSGSSIDPALETILHVKLDWTLHVKFANSARAPA